MKASENERRQLVTSGSFTVRRQKDRHGGDGDPGEWTGADSAWTKLSQAQE